MWDFSDLLLLADRKSLMWVAPGIITLTGALLTYKRQDQGPWLLALGIAWLCISTLIHRLDRDL